MADSTLDLLLSHGLISVVHADRDLAVTLARGNHASDIAAGESLCHSLPALSGLEDEISALADQSKQSIIVANAAVVDQTGTRERLDYVVVYDSSSDCFAVSISPSHAHDDVRVDRERDLRARMRLEARVAAQASAISEANDALKRTNQDLVDFTRIISHDLKAPMRAIRYSADDIEASMRDGALSGADADALEDLQTYTRRMSQMVTDLLAYSRLDDKLKATASVDTRDVVDVIVETLPRPAGLGIEIQGDWPKITTVGALLDVVLRNLIENAIKHHDREVGQIIVGAGLRDTFLEISITDDGPGIPERHRLAVLRPFVRLDSHQPEGSGMGLRMAPKMVNGVGGWLKLDGREEEKRGLRITVGWPLTIKAI